jgi:hypothetical protein
MGSEFTPYRYLAPDRTFVNSSMRSYVVKVKHLYKEMYIA